MKIKRGSISVRRLIFIADSSSTVGAGLTNLAFNTASLVAYYFAGDLSNEVQITLATATLGAFASGGFVAVDNTNMPGWYEIGIPDAALDGGIECAIQFRGAANMVPVNIHIELDSFDYQTETQPVNVTQFGGLNLTATAGIPEVKVASIAADAITASALAADAVAEIQSGLATPTNITAGTITTVTNLTNAPTVGDLTAAMKASVTAAVPTVASIQSGLATPTNITAGTITTVTNLTNAPTVGDLTAAMKASVTAAVPTVASIQSGLATPTNITAGTITTTTNLTNAPTSGDLTAAMKASVTAAVPTVASIQSGLATPTNITAATGITVSSIGANVVNASALAADAVTEIQSGLATAANLLIVSDGVGFLTSVMLGTISDAGTAGETYVITFGGATYTSDFAGLDATGNRTGVTRTKV